MSNNASLGQSIWVKLSLGLSQDELNVKASNYLTFLNENRTACMCVEIIFFKLKDNRSRYFLPWFFHPHPVFWILSGRIINVVLNMSRLFDFQSEPAVVTVHSTRSDYPLWSRHISAYSKQYSKTHTAVNPESSRWFSDEKSSKCSFSL